MEKVALLGPDGKSTGKHYKIIEEIEGKTTVVRLEDTRTGQIIRTPRSRIITKEQKMSEDFTCSKCGKELSSKSGLTLHSKKCSGSSKKATPKKKTVAVPVIDKFDVRGFAQDNGGEVWAKELKFDHPTIKVRGFQILDEGSGFYHTFNTYNGSLGKNSRGVTRYPLKGKAVTYTISEKVEKQESRGQKRIRKGKKTAEQVRKLWQKNGYRKQ